MAGFVLLGSVLNLSVVGLTLKGPCTISGLCAQGNGSTRHPSGAVPSPGETNELPYPVSTTISITFPEYVPLVSSARGVWV